LPLLAGLVMLMLIFNYGQLWFQAFWSKAPVTFLELLGMSLRKVNARTIVQAKIMATQAGLGRDDLRPANSRPTTSPAATCRA
jgi:uncharacterized protein YqfA (UPF0365 family)